MLMRRLLALGALTASLATAPSAWAQTPQTPPPASSSSDTTGAATTTTLGDTGLWHVPIAEVLPSKKWSISFYRTNDGQGLSDISTFPVTFGVGLGDHAELFASWALVTRIDRDSTPIFFSTTPTAAATGTAGGILINYPLNRSHWTGSTLGDAWIGAKINLASQADDRPLAFAVRGAVKLPTGSTAQGTSSGKADFAVAAVASSDARIVELSAFGGLIVRGNPTGYTLSNGVQWGVGTAFPARTVLRATAEIVGERYFNQTITAPAGLVGSDGSSVPTVTTLESPVTLNLGLTMQLPQGFFIGGNAVWNFRLAGRTGVAAVCASGTSCPSFRNLPRDAGIEVRLGYHPGARKAASEARSSRAGGPATGPGAGAPGGAGAGVSPGARAGAPGAAGAGAGAPAGAAGAPAGAGAGTPPAGAGAAANPNVRANRPPTVRAACEPCTVEVGKTSLVTADAQDPDGDPLSYQWTAPLGSFLSPTNRQSVWTAPMQVGPVPVTIVVNDGRGGTARDSVTIQVVRAAAREFTFEDVHFDFDRFTLRADALRLLDDAVSAMQANPSLRIQIEGNTCNIGTAEYNLALGDRRAKAVRDYLVSRGIDAERMTTVSYGQERPKYDNSREETRRLNRRAALVVKLQ
jgi:outer membrane protein OmpA-like peptidoglycan-associated protein